MYASISGSDVSSFVSIRRIVSYSLSNVKKKYSLSLFCTKMTGTRLDETAEKTNLTFFTRYETLITRKKCILAPVQYSGEFVKVESSESKMHI